MAKVLDLIYRVKDSASLPIKKIKKEQDSFNTSLASAQKIYTTTIASLTGVAVATGKLIQKYQDFTIETGELAHSMGITTEEMSALQEITGDLGIPVATLGVAFRKMAKEGINPSIEGLIQVRAKLDGARSEADRLALAQKYLGKSGADLLPIFDQLTNEQLRNYINTLTEAQKVTEAEFAAAVANRRALAEWGDTYESTTLSIGGFLTKGLIPYLKILNAAPGIFERSALAMAAWWAEALNLSDAVKEAIRLQRLDFEAKNSVASAITGTLIPAIEDYKEELAGIPASINTNLTISRGNFGGSIGTGTGAGGGGGGSNNPWGGNPLGWNRAAGGPVAAGGTFLVGEKGPELFTPATSGTITPNADRLADEVHRLIRVLPIILRDAAAKR